MTTGQIDPNGGRVVFNGQDVTPLPMYRRARLGMGYLTQETSVFRKLTVEQNILAILEAMPICRSLGRKLTRKERWQRTDAALEQFGLTKVRKNNAARLSGGEKRRLEIARCLVCEPLLILLDEPFTGIDPKTIADIQEIVRELRRQGIGMLLTDHNVREALKITDRSYLIKDGKVRTHGTPQQIINDPIAINEYLGRSFTDNTFGNEPPQYTATTLATPAALSAPSVAPVAPLPSSVPDEAAAPATVHLVLEQEKVFRLIERLKTTEHTMAARELVEHGTLAVPALLDALERRDVELRRVAFVVLHEIVHGDAVFDPYAPEALRRQQISDLRRRLERKAG
jgi:lipopolysaccharide export system ATP-binding protein